MGLLAPLPLKTHDDFSLFCDVLQTVEQTALTRSDLAFSFSKSKISLPAGLILFPTRSLRRRSISSRWFGFTSIRSLHRLPRLSGLRAAASGVAA
jgi:hypothetical protein